MLFSRARAPACMRACMRRRARAYVRATRGQWARGRGAQCWRMHVHTCVYTLTRLRMLARRSIYARICACDIRMCESARMQARAYLPVYADVSAHAFACAHLHACISKRTLCVHMLTYAHRLCTYACTYMPSSMYT